MRPMNETIDPEVRAKFDAMVADLPFNEQIPRRSGDVAFDKAWEIRAFAIATAMHRQGAFDWPEFQGALIESIQSWEASADDTADWRYYDRWMEALEQLLVVKGLVQSNELDHRTVEVLATPANANHHHAVREPVAVVPGRSHRSADG